MTSINKVLIVLDVYQDFRDDPSHQPLEIEKAIELIANPETARIYLVGCGFEEFLHDTYSNFGPEAIKQRKEFVAEMERRLMVFAAALSARGYKIECRVHWTYPRYEQITREAIDLDVDLVVQHVNIRQPFERHNLSHDTWQLVKTCPRPMLLTRDRPWPDEPVIVAAVDPVHSHHKPLGLDFRILDRALETGKLVGGTIHVVHAFSESARPFARSGSMRRLHGAAMDDLLKDYSIPAGSVHLLDETPVNALMQCREALRADIIVIGALSRSRITDSIIGNTANRVLDYVKADLMIVKPS